MSENTKIEWADHTYNPWTGCMAVSPGCANCYAAAWAKRAGRDFAERQRTKTAGDPVKWNAQHAAFFGEHGRRQRVFCASLADWADNQVPIEWLVDLLRLWRATPNLDWLVLTKRIGIVMSRLREAFDWLCCQRGCAGDALLRWVADWLEGRPPANVWIGATVVDQAEADRDIPKLLGVPARGRFLSVGPMLGPILINPLFIKPIEGSSQHGQRFIDWILSEGESGRHARPMHPDWARSLRDQCAAAGVPYLHKQWGEWLPGSQAREVGDQMAIVGACDRGWRWDDGTHSWRIGKTAAGRLLDGVEHDEFPS